MENYQDTIISQYANSPTIVALIATANDALDTDDDIDNFYNLIWNIATANDVGLAIWGRIVGVGRTLQLPATLQFFGFQEANSVPGSIVAPLPWNQGVFYNGPVSSSAFTLSTEAYRTLVLVKAAGNISDCTPASVNRLLTMLFAGRGVCYMQDNLDMTIAYVFHFTLQPYEIAILELAGVIPKAGGVNVTVQIILP